MRKLSPKATGRENLKLQVLLRKIALPCVLMFRELGRGEERNQVALTFSRVTGVFEEIKGGQCRNSVEDKVSKIFRKAMGSPACQISSLKYRHRELQGDFSEQFCQSSVDAPGRPFYALRDCFIGNLCAAFTNLAVEMNACKRWRETTENATHCTM